MKMTGNTIFITGGGSGIGRGLAEAFHRLGNKVIISGRRAERLQATIDSQPRDGSGRTRRQPIPSLTSSASPPMCTSKHPALNILINNAGVMLLDDVDGAIDEPAFRQDRDHQISAARSG